MSALPVPQKFADMDDRRRLGEHVAEQRRAAATGTHDVDDLDVSHVKGPSVRLCTQESIPLLDPRCGEADPYWPSSTHPGDTWQSHRFFPTPRYRTQFGIVSAKASISVREAGLKIEERQFWPFPAAAVPQCLQCQFLAPLASRTALDASPLTHLTCDAASVQPRRPPIVDAGAGGEIRYPWTKSHPTRLSQSSCSESSTPSVTIVSPRSWPNRTTASTKLASTKICGLGK